MTIKKTALILCLLLCQVLISACNPTFNWREIHSADAPFTMLMPAKPESFTQPVQLGESKLNMTMTATEVDHLSFAVGSAKVSNQSSTAAILTAMQQGMINNIHGQIIEAPTTSGGVMRIAGRHGETEVIMAARFIARGDWVYQLVMMGPPQKMSPEIIETFMNSFVAN